MRVPEAAEYFRVPRTRMYELIQRGELPAVRLGQRSIRVNRVEVERYLAESRRVALLTATDAHPAGGGE